MRDQAEKLRQTIQSIKNSQIKHEQESSQRQNALLDKTCKVITITSGKGGVGKTNFTVNFAIGLAQAGLKVVILDADFGLANIDVVMGSTSSSNLLDVIEGRKNILEIMCEGPENVRFISGGSGIEQLINLNEEQIDSLVNNMSMLDSVADVILVDTGAGLSESVMRFVLAADEVILVTTPEPTSITDAYALIKLVAKRDREKTINIVVNRAENRSEASEIAYRISFVAEKFLNMKINPLGYILYDEAVIKSVKMQQPYMIAFPSGKASSNMKEICNKMLVNKQVKNGILKETGVLAFLKKIIRK